MHKKVFVTGVFDLLHSGHVAFLQEAATYGDLYVGIGSDKTVLELKGRHSLISEEERKYMLGALACVKKVSINSGTGILDFKQDIIKLHPDIFIVNADGHTIIKETLCKELDIEYKILKRIPYANLPARSTHDLRQITSIPYRIDIAGTWIDQPYVSTHHPGWAITASIEPTIDFNERSGMATSTRKNAIELWNNKLPLDKPEKLAKILFRYDNDPGAKEISGSQDAIGISLPGINRFFYEKGEYWPTKFETISDIETIQWLENRLFMITLWPRPSDYAVLCETNINAENVKRLSDASQKTWQGLLDRDFELFSQGFAESFSAQVTLFPKMLNTEIGEVIDKYRTKAKAWKLSGAGGGGYLILLNEEEIPNTIKVKIRIKESLI